MNKFRAFLYESKVDLIFLIIVGIAFYVFSNNFAMLSIQGSSMSPTYEDGNILILKKDRNISRKDIVVFEPPKEWGTNTGRFIKRIIAIEGDTVEFINDEIFVNGEITPHNKTQCELSSDVSFIINKGEYFVMGDNIANSNDSVAQYCMGNEYFLIDENSLFVHGKEFHVIRRYFGE